MGISVSTMVSQCLMILFLVGWPVSVRSAPRDGDYYYQRAQANEGQGYYVRAKRDFRKAAILYGREADAVGLAQAKNDWFRMECVIGEYCLSAGKLKRLIRKCYPWAERAEVEDWIATKVFLSLDMERGVQRFFEGEVDNLHFRNPEIMDGVAEHSPGQASTDAMMQMLLDDYVNADYTGFTLPFDRPQDILIDFQLRIRRSKLPRNGDGLVRVWMPMPINTDCQGDIEVVCLEPAEHLVTPPDFDADLGLAYFEIPVAGVKRELVVRAQIRYRHFQQRFEIDPPSIGAYDEGSDLFLTYTAASTNIQITPAITALAQTIVGAETNPYLQAKLIYDHILGNVDYSYTPHGTLQTQAEAESEFVREHQYGDCGAQSMFFSALCRSLGIPARTCGGYQLLRGGPGTHFWAEFYVPAPYDRWIPVDPTVGEFWKNVRGFSAPDMASFREYFFGQQDPLRLVIQNDVDVVPAPVPTEEDYFKVVVQDPVVIYAGATVIAGDVDTYQNSYLDFNFDQAHTLAPGAVFAIDAADFGLGTFPKDAKIVLVDQYHGKTVTVPAAIQGDPEGQVTINGTLPDDVDEIAYALWLKSRSVGDAQSTRYVIVQVP